MISQAIIIASIVLFLHSCSWEHMIFGGIQKFIKPADDNHPNRWLYKPIYGCPICMTPWWGTLIYVLFFFGGFNLVTLKDWLLTVGAASGFSVVSVILLSIRDACLKYEDSD